MTLEEEIRDKEATVQDQYDSLRIVYKEIIQGYTFDFESSFYIKHCTESESIDPIIAKKYFFDEAVSRGLLCEKDKEKSLKDSGDWTEEMNEEIIFLEQFIRDNEDNLSKIVIPNQRVAINKIIDQKRNDLIAKKLEKSQIFGLTAESYSEKKSSNYLIFNSLFSDKKLTKPLYTKEEFDSIDYEELYYYMSIYNKIMNRFSERNMRKIAVMPFFLNSIAAAVEQPMFFLNKPVTEFTVFQLSIFNRGKRNRFVLSNAKGDPPDLLPHVKIQEVLDWYDSNYSIAMAKYGSDSD